MLLGRVVSLLLQMPDLCIHKTMYSISPTAGKCTKLLWWKTAYFYGVPSRGFPTVIFFFKYLLELNFQVRIKKFFLENWAKIHLVIFFHLKKKIDKHLIYKHVSIFYYITGKWQWSDNIFSNTSVSMQRMFRQGASQNVEGLERRDKGNKW